MIYFFAVYKNFVHFLSNALSAVERENENQNLLQTSLILTGFHYSLVKTDTQSLPLERPLFLTIENPKLLQ